MAKRKVRKMSVSEARAVSALKRIMGASGVSKPNISRALRQLGVQK